MPNIFSQTSSLSPALRLPPDASVPFAFYVGGHARGGFAGGWFLPIPILAGPQLASIIIDGSVFGQALAKIADTLP
jgi:hypothetical protein